ncbi:pirin family protein [Paenibacillus sinopodophylli]|uniref:pirin family protein n=1 Tax=Paenibacillus sinopodophylli TaxID=1837342 RepID=UPI00110CCFD5|nr:pirin family protein [Paenibacillus sinopodophylli]
MKVNVYTPLQQAVGSFEGGRIIEQKPIGFPQEQEAVKGVGPLFYWAWAHAKEGGSIGLHPHKGFEIMTYVVNGIVEHGDTLGTESIVGSGGAQVMQTGSGVSHREKITGPDAEIFQIWFEPDLNESVKRKPTYHDYHAEDFPTFNGNGVHRKTILGEESPIQLVTDVQMWDLTLEEGTEYTFTIPEGYAAAVLAIRGDGLWSFGAEGASRAIFKQKDFTVLEAQGQAELIQLVIGDKQARLIFIQVPVQVEYPLYQR